MVGKAKGKPLELSLPSRIVNKKQYYVPGGIAEISTTIKDLKDAGVGFPPNLLSALQFGPCGRQTDYGE